VVFISLKSYFLQIEYTATDDLKFRLVQNDLWIREANIHIYDNDAYYGDTNNQSGVIASGNGLTFQDFNLADIFFKNFGAGSNTRVVAECIIMTNGKKRELEID